MGGDRPNEVVPCIVRVHPRHLAALGPVGGAAIADTVSLLRAHLPRLLPHALGNFAEADAAKRNKKKADTSSSVFQLSEQVARAAAAKQRLRGTAGKGAKGKGAKGKGAKGKGKGKGKGGAKGGGQQEVVGKRGIAAGADANPRDAKRARVGAGGGGAGGGGGGAGGAEGEASPTPPESTATTNTFDWGHVTGTVTFRQTESRYAVLSFVRPVRGAGGGAAAAGGVEGAGQGAHTPAQAQAQAQAQGRSFVGHELSTVTVVVDVRPVTPL